MKTMFSKDFWQIDHLRTTWEYKSVALILRAMLAIVVVMYLLLTAPAAWSWLQAVSVRALPAENFARVLETAIATDDFAPVQRWITYRPRSERADHAAVLEARIEDIPAPLVAVIVEASRARGAAEATRFWLMMARYRLRFDVLRCGQPDLIDALKQAQMMATALPHLRNELAAIDSDRAGTIRLLQQVLDYDAKYPARNSPAFTCTLMQGLSASDTNLTPPDTWATTRHTLRLVTERAVADLKAGKQ